MSIFQHEKNNDSDILPLDLVDATSLQNADDFPRERIA